VVEDRLTRDQIWLADEVFFTGTAAEVTPVREIDNRTVGDGTVGPSRRSSSSGSSRSCAAATRLTPSG
jgi:branched-chain amino acid aminotransferase